MDKASELLSMIEFYPCEKKYMGCTCQIGRLGDCETPSLNTKIIVLGDCGGECGQ